MSIYTKTGDKGKTSLYGGKRILKSDPQIETYGSLDELNSFIGSALVELENKNDLTHIQKILHRIMAFLAGKTNIQIDLNDETKALEESIDKIEERLPNLNGFILPQGSEAATRLHIARTVCRRCERIVAGLASGNKRLKIFDDVILGMILQYLNRLSDYLFVLARENNKEKELLI
jgi:cob(I)alamin adenosyltransferase